MERLDLLVLGEANVDLIVRAPDPMPVYGQEKLLQDLILTIGGSASIFACQAAKLGLRTAIASIVGDDDLGHFMLRSLGRQGVSTEYVRRTSQEKTGASISLSAAGDRAFLTYLGAVAALDSAMIDPRWLAQARHVHVASYFLQPGLAHGLPGLLARAREAGATVSLDPGWDPANRWNSGLQAVLAHVDLFFPNEVEALSISGQETIAGALANLAEGIPVVAIKLGREGAVARQGAEMAHATALPIEVTDTTGAGDSFDAGFVYGHLQGLPLAQCLELGILCGGLSTRAAGGTAAQPSLEEIRAAQRPGRV